MIKGSWNLFFYIRLSGAGGVGRVWCWQRRRGRSVLVLAVGGSNALPAVGKGGISTVLLSVSAGEQVVGCLENRPPMRKLGLVVVLDKEGVKSQPWEQLVEAAVVGFFVKDAKRRHELSAGRAVVEKVALFLQHSYVLLSEYPHGLVHVASHVNVRLVGDANVAKRGFFVNQFLFNYVPGTVSVNRPKTAVA